jgi:hypothetical protein
MMKFAIFSFSLTLISSGKIDKYPCTGMWNSVCIVIVVEHKQNVVMLVVVDNNIFCQVFENVMWCISQK